MTTVRVESRNTAMRPPETRRLLLFFGSESQEAAVQEGTQLWGKKGRALGCHILPQSDFASLLPFAMRSEDTHTPGANGLVPTGQPMVPTWESPGYRGFLAPATRAGSSKKSLWNQKGQKWGGLSLSSVLARGPIPAPRRRCLRPVAWRHT